MNPPAALRRVEVEGHLVEAADRLGREPGSQRDDERVVVESPAAVTTTLLSRSSASTSVLQELDPLPLQPVERPAELARTALAHHLPQERRLVDVLGGAVEEHDPVVGREPMPELARSHQPTGAHHPGQRCSRQNRRPGGRSALPPWGARPSAGSRSRSRTRRTRSPRRSPCRPAPRERSREPSRSSAHETASRHRRRSRGTRDRTLSSRRCRLPRSRTRRCRRPRARRRRTARGV